MKQTLTPEQMRHLSELGCSTRNASMCLIRDTDGNRYLSVHDEYCYGAAYMDPIPAYTLADIIEMLPKNINWGVYALKIDMSGMSVSYVDTSDVRCDSKLWFISFREKPLIDALYETLCWCLENKYIEIKEK